MALAGSTLGERIVEIRSRRLALTQAEFAAKLRSRNGNAVNQAQVSRWERDVAEPSSHYLRQIARLGGVEIGELFGENGAAAA